MTPQIRVGGSRAILEYFVQYLAPTCALLLAIFLYDESVPAIRWFTFSMIWLAVVIFSVENVYQYRKRGLGDAK